MPVSTLLPTRIPGRWAPLFLALALVLGLSSAARATHLVGGEMDLQYLQGNSYQFTLNLYFDAVNGNPGALDNDLTVSIFEKGSNRRMLNLSLPLTTNTLVNYTNPACTRAELVTRRIVYAARVELPASIYSNGAGYYAAVERCCRNNGINNIVSPADAGQTFYLEFPPVVRNGLPFRDSTPRIFPPLSDYACLGELFYYDFGGLDSDGDSLVYELATPFNGYSTTGVPKPTEARPQPYPEVRWLAGLSEQNQIPGAPTLSINSLTGRLEVRPTDVGLFVFGIKCSEFRDGVKIGETRRDFQLKVVSCPRNTAPVMNVQLPGTSRSYLPGRDTLRLRPGFSRCISLRFTDADSPSRLSLSVRPVNFPATLLPSFTLTQGMVKTPGAPDTLVSQLCFPACFDSKGQVYLLDVIVADDGCSLPKRDTVRVAFTAIPDPNSPPTITTTAVQPLRARVGELITFDVTGADADNDPLTLTMTGVGFTPTDQGITFTPGVSGNQIRGRVSWRVDCRAVGRPLYELDFLVSSTLCAEAQTVRLRVPIQIEYSNSPPVLSSNLPPTPAPTEPPIRIRRVVGGVYEATFTGTDADNNPLVLSATGNGFELAAAGMSFRATNGSGTASALFRWEANCAGLKLPEGALEVTFQLQETTCRPEPQTRVVRFELINPDTLAFTPPNIFTPNNDPNQRNEFFTIPNLPPDFCDSRFAGIKVFSRWGNQVYESKLRNFRWNGGQQPAGVYFYLIEFTDGRKYKGPITLER
ncbi:T9SS type B sorting domain-containing protein [Hymenobacter psychrotolerans]|uniref:Gliding motility-associated C-terminal domain-containing protein n=1 Tax=Hymenobacter psychrotolerans DSM 18569 TaxID=1121959 RepID=A0A1M6SR26_9BACT|nr:gliding motility-associated C-terminal domain-containing protein [Hymenobacter psychrotolerans]SHK47038.1 gliding motility-associated C-terminal domain-containing protein [Hymenobacter psychrotolerans DSM 18569]